VQAQFNSAVQGVVTDSSEAPIPAAAVVVRNIDTGVERTAETLDDGLYRVLSLGPGKYRISVKKAGFAEEVRDQVTLATGEQLRADFSLRVGTQQAEVTVTGQPTLVDTEQSNISGKLNQLELKETPLNGNNVFNLLALQAGVVGRSRSNASGGGGRSGNDPFSGENSA